MCTRKRVRVWARVCVCVCEREREIVCKREYVGDSVSERERMCVNQRG